LNDRVPLQKAIGYHGISLLYRNMGMIEKPSRILSRRPGNDGFQEAGLKTL